MSDSFDQMVKEFKSIAKLREFAEAQHNTIIQLSKKLNSIETENKTLKSLVEQKNLAPTSIADELKDVSDIELICRTQLCLLKDKALRVELTLEEAKKLDIYSKVLNGLPKGDDTDPALNKLSDVELLKLVETTNEPN